MGRGTKQAAVPIVWVFLYNFVGGNSILKGGLG